MSFKHPQRGGRQAGVPERTVVFATTTGRDAVREAMEALGLETRALKGGEPRLEVPAGMVEGTLALATRLYFGARPALAAKMPEVRSDVRPDLYFSAAGIQDSDARAPRDGVEAGTEYEYATEAGVCDVKTPGHGTGGKWHCMRGKGHAGDHVATSDEPKQVWARWANAEDAR